MLPFGKRDNYLDPYIIAEIGVNHEGSVERAMFQIEAVARAGGHAAKFQTYKAETIASRDHSPSYWDRRQESTPTQFELFSKLDTFGADDYRLLANHCKKVGIDFLSTPFDLEAVDSLDALVPYFKVASADITNMPLLRKVGQKGKPVILSVGASSFAEMDAALNILTVSGATDVALMHCVLQYPTPLADANLSAIPTLKRRYGEQCTIGYSDHVAPSHTGDLPALDMAALFGAQVIEKHFTDDRNAKGNDHYHAMDELGLAAFRDRLGTYRAMLGTGEPDLVVQAAARANARRRIFVTRDVLPGQKLSEANLIALRSNVGIEVSKWDSIVGRTASKMLSAGEPVTIDAIQE